MEVFQGLYKWSFNLETYLGRFMPILEFTIWRKLQTKIFIEASLKNLNCGIIKENT